MGTEIKASGHAAQQVSSGLLRGVHAYEAFALTPLMPSLSCAGSAEHDSAISSLMREALEAYGTLIDADADSVRGVASTLFESDVRLASVFGSGGTCVS